MPSLPFPKIKQLIDDGAAPGCAVVIDSPEGVQSFAYGHFAEAGSPQVSTHTSYDVASLTKLFTTAVILRLQEAGALSIDDRCGMYLENFQASDITLLHLLTHRTGMEIHLREYRARYPAAEALRSALLHIQPPRHAGSSVWYSDLNFIYLGMIVEQATHTSLDEAFHLLFQELGLQETYTGPELSRLGIATPPTEVVDGTVIQGVTHNETARIFGGLSGNAGIFSSASDLARFGVSWLDGRILPDPALRQIVFSDHDTAGSEPQAIGWWLRYTLPDGTQHPTPGIFCHGGYNGAFLAIQPSTNTVCALTCNRTYYGRDNLQHRLLWECLIDWMRSTAEPGHRA